MNENERDPLTEQVIGAAIEVHRVLGPGLLESVYEHCLSHELKARGIDHRTQLELPVVYKGAPLDCHFFMDLVIPGRLVVELKTVEKLMPIHQAQLLTYMKLSGIRPGLLLNFHVALLRGCNKMWRHVSNVPENSARWKRAATFCYSL